MKAFVAVALIAASVPAVLSTLPTGITIGSGFALPVFTLGSSTATTGAAAGAITGLASGTALAAGLGGVVAAAGAGALAALALRRGKRATDSIAAEADINANLLFDAIDAMDGHECGKRYVCELAATPVELLSQAEFSALLLFQTGETASASKAKFDEAIRLGVVSRSGVACRRRYASCPTIEA